jgi:hypothetical protein
MSPARLVLATRRSALALGSACAKRPPGSRANNAANLCAAASLDNSVSSAATSQGSTSSRARAERTLTGILFLSAPISAYRKSSNSGR